MNVVLATLLAIPLGFAAVILLAVLIYGMACITLVTGAATQADSHDKHEGALCGIAPYSDIPNC